MTDRQKSQDKPQHPTGKPGVKSDSQSKDEVMGDSQLTEQSEKAHSQGGTIDRSKTPGVDYDV